MVMHVERRSAHTLDNHPIPEMTDPLGKYWNQPSRELITIDDKYALMSNTTFASLHDYSCSFPSGVYPGKMWKQGRPYVNPVRWYLLWYDYSEQGPEYCSNKIREIIIS